MGALRQPRLSEHTENLRKPPQTETKPPSSLEKLRARTNYAKGEGWCAFPFAAFTDLLKLSSGEVCWRFIMAVNAALSSGSRSPKEAWAAWTDERTSQEWADSCLVNVRDIQRQISELQARGMIAVKQVKKGTIVKYSVSLLYPKWGELEPYAVWKRAQVVAIDESLGEEVEDEAPAVISKDAVRLTKKPQRIGPGRSSRAVAVNVGVSSFRFQSADTKVDLLHDTVIQSGCLIVSVASQKSECKAKGEENKNDTHVADIPTPGGSSIGETPRQSNNNRNLQSQPPALTVDHPRAAELIKIFDPLLAAGHVALLSSDLSSLSSACSAIQDCDHNYLVKFAVQRAARKIGSPRSVVAICTEAAASERASKVLDGAGLQVASKAEIDALIAKERAERLGKKR